MKKDKIIVLIIGVVIIGLSVGYSAFGTTLSISNLVSSIRLNQDIRITGISVVDGINEGISNYEEYNTDDISMGINLPNENSSVRYKINITNFESTEMGLFNITGLPDNLEYTFYDNNYNLKEKICVDNKCNLGISKDIYIDISYKEGMYNKDNIEYNLKLTFDFRKFHKIVYDNIGNNGLPIEIIDGNNLIVNFGTNYPETIKIYMNKEEINDYNYQNGILSIENITGDIVIALPGSANIPVLDTGMIPIKISNDGVATTVANNDPTWYNYDNKEWANVVLVKEEGINSREYYKSNTNVTVEEEDILAYYVWIPRYKYRITRNCSSVNNPTPKNNPECFAPYTISESDKTELATAILIMAVYEYEMENFTMEQASYLVDEFLENGYYILDGSDYITLSQALMAYYLTTDKEIIATPSTFDGSKTTMGPTTIDIEFETANTAISKGDAVNTYYTHPAFIWDGETISGIWVGKFESTGDEITPIILPNESESSKKNISTYFNTSLKFSGGSLIDGEVTFIGDNTYGLTSHTDSHMMKNSEWGAVAYLSHSKYGINYEIRSNNTTITGCGALEEGLGATSECQIEYGSGITLYPQSTTGNITGIFDMSGGRQEIVMGVYSDSNGNPMSGYSLEQNSGFNGLLGDGTEYNSGILFPNSKYYDLYLKSQFSGDFGTNISLCTLDSCGGHALNETNQWYFDLNYFVDQNDTWFNRGYYNYGEINSGAFSSYSVGFTTDSSTWRSVLIANIT